MRSCLLVAALGTAASLNLNAQTITITAPDNNATEAGVYPGLFRVERSGSTTDALPVTLAWSGTATADADYHAGPVSVTIPAGAAFVEFPLDPINDPIAEADTAETVIATIQPDAGYNVGSPDSAAVTITEDETLALTAPFLYSAVPASATSVTLKWVDVFETETKFRVQYRAAGTTAWTTIDSIPPNTTTRTVTGLTTGQLYEFRVDAYQGSTSSKTINPVVVALIEPDAAVPVINTYEQWRSAMGLGGELRNSHGRTFDDPDADGRKNLMEYLFGSDPLASDAGSGFSINPSGTNMLLQWPDSPAGISDAWSTLEESTTLAPASWASSPLTVTAASGTRSATDSRGGTARFYRVAGAAASVEPAPLITCWGDSLTGNPGTYAEKLPTLLPGRSTQNCGVGGDTTLQIADRMRGLTITSPYPSYAVSTPAGTNIRIVASRTTHARVMTPTGTARATYAATISNINKVEFFNRGVKIGESSTPLAASVTSNRATNATRLLAAGHPFSNGDVVHFPAGPLPSPLIIGKTYFVRDADANGFSLVADDVSFTIAASSSRLVSSNHDFVDGDVAWFRPGATISGFFADRPYYVRDSDSAGFSLSDTPGGAALTTAYAYTGVILGKPGRIPVSLAADFTTSTAIRGPFVFNWSHPGGPTKLSLRTHTDRDANTFILWMGRNNNARPHEVYADIHAAVEHIKTLNSRFLIVSVTNGDNGTPSAVETVGNQYYTGTVNLNYLIQKEFPDNFVDVRAALIRAASSSADDQIDRAADVPPGSLRDDNVHFNGAGQQIIAEILADQITARGW
jgi:hypothetical protein